MIGRPSQNYFKVMIRSKLIHNFPLTVSDIVVSEKSFGSDVRSLHGKTVRRAPDPVRTDYVAIPPEIWERMGPIELTEDFFS